MHKNRLPLLALLAFVAAGAAQAQPVVVAKRGAAQVTMADIDARMSEIPADKREGFIDSPSRIESMVSQLLLIKQLASEARTEHLENDPEYQSKLALAQERLLAEARMRQLATLPLSGDMAQSAKEIYLSKPERFDTGEVTVVRHLIVKTDAEAKALQARAEKGESFEALVKEASLDRDSAVHGGLIDVGQNAPQIQPAVATAARKLAKPNEFATVQTPQGVVLMQFVERKPSRKLSFDEVKSLLVNEATMKARDAQLKGHLDSLSNLPLDANPETVASLRTRYANGAIPAFGSAR
ncbi:MAG TPA: peptidylprolyl isomerase [Xanthomonadales bacterium]|nr:peptidylprolyl isomerase [Xanthomonadales bacterium]